ncbi:MAG: TetR/AcrR family transcriptional regulator [Thermoplasmata archaeon]
MMSRKEDSEKKIINAAIEVFSRDGYDVATTDEIARKSGLSKGTIFVHFKKKDDLIQKVALMSVPYDIITEAIEKKYAKPEDILTELGLLFMNKYRDPEMRALLIMTMAHKGRYKKIEQRLKSACMNKMDLLFGMVEKMMDTKISVPIRRAYFGSLLCYTIWWDESNSSPEEYVKTLVQDILKSVKGTDKSSV